MRASPAHLRSADELPGIPSVGEFVPSYEASVWYGIGAPRNTPVEIVDKLNEAINAGLADLKLKAQFSDVGGTVMMGWPADFGKFIAEETEKWSQVIRTLNLKAE